MELQIGRLATGIVILITVSVVVSSPNTRRFDSDGEEPMRAAAAVEGDIGGSSRASFTGDRLTEDVVNRRLFEPTLLDILESMDAMPVSIEPVLVSMSEAAEELTEVDNWSDQSVSRGPSLL